LSQGLHAGRVGFPSWCPADCHPGLADDRAMPLGPQSGPADFPNWYPGHRRCPADCYRGPADDRAMPLGPQSGPADFPNWCQAGYYRGLAIAEDSVLPRARTAIDKDAIHTKDFLFGMMLLS
jgi:hypothetical protein